MKIKNTQQKKCVHSNFYSQNESLSKINSSPIPSRSCAMLHSVGGVRNSKQTDTETQVSWSEFIRS